MPTVHRDPDSLMGSLIEFATEDGGTRVYVVVGILTFAAKEYAKDFFDTIRPEHPVENITPVMLVLRATHGPCPVEKLRLYYPSTPELVARIKANNP